MKKLLVLVGLLLPLQAGAIGAIAVDDARGYDEPGYGYSLNEPTREAAERNALKYCQRYAEHCRNVVWFETCGAYAASPRHYGYGWGATKARAVEGAMKMCGTNKCKLIVAQCEK